MPELARPQSSRKNGIPASLLGLLCLICTACTPSRPAGVPENAEFVSKGSYPWHSCNRTGELEHLDLYRCSDFNGDGQEVNSGWYVSVPQQPHTDTMLALPEAVNHWSDAEWWKGDMLLLVFQTQSFARHTTIGGVAYSRDERLYFADKECISLIGAGDFDSLEKKLPELQALDGLDRIHPRFVSGLGSLASDPGAPFRSERPSPCLVHRYYLSN
jgi:hypothetical protein